MKSISAALRCKAICAMALTKAISLPGLSGIVFTSAQYRRRERNQENE
jgi:hypothetical protein